MASRGRSIARDASLQRPARASPSRQPARPEKHQDGTPMFKGSFTALITPFKNGKVDEDDVRAASSSGRSRRARMASFRSAPPARRRRCRHDEHKRVVELCIEVARKRVPVIAGAGSNSTDEAIELTRVRQEGGRRRRRCIRPATTTSRRRKGSTCTSRRSATPSTCRSSSTTCPAAPSSTSLPATLARMRRR